jgi:hypothetical protein
MTNQRIVTIVAFASLVTAVPQAAAAQDFTPATPTRMEVGGSVTFIQTLTTGSPRFTLNFNARHAIQTGADFRFYQSSYSRETSAMYTVEYRYTLPVSLRATRIFMTAGALGMLEWSHQNAYTARSSGFTYTNISGEKVTVAPSEYTFPAYSDFDWVPPVYPIVGAGFEHRLNRRLLVRADAQVIVPFDDEFYLVPRVSVGLVVSLGKSVR